MEAVTHAVNFLICVPLVVITGSYVLPIDEPTCRNRVRFAYWASSMICIALWVKIGCAIMDKRGKAALRHDMTLLEFRIPDLTKPWKKGRAVTTTVHDYDMQQWRVRFRAQCLAIAVTWYLHLYHRFHYPLVIQVVLPLKLALESELAMIHLFGRPATGKLARPWIEGASEVKKACEAQSEGDEQLPSEGGLAAHETRSESRRKRRASRKKSSVAAAARTN
ncbi:hypothetical protein KEM52_005753 [Ascosphaera acerosa]|nr:hypothetical protein KEM52_005753 [Ascosphaera acerosa]